MCVRVQNNMNASWRDSVYTSTTVTMFLMTYSPLHCIPPPPPPFHLLLRRRLVSTECAPTLIVVSHDRAFLDATTTKVIVMEKKTLRYFNGSFGEFEVAEMEDAARKAGLLDARVRQEEKARASIEKMKAGAKAHTNLKQAKQKQNKMEVRKEEK